MPLLRLSEPAFSSIAVTRIREYMCCLKKEKLVKKVTPLTVFLSSSMNVELVYVILKGIT